MKRPIEFSKSTVLAFSILLCMYAPVCIMGYITYGDSLRDSVINSIQTQWIQQAVNLLITIHCILTLTIIFNPLNQEVEDLLHVPQAGEKRAEKLKISRGYNEESDYEPLSFGEMLRETPKAALIISGIIAAGEKRAEKMKISRGYNEESDYEPLSFGEMLRETPKAALIISGIIAAIGIIGGAAATYSAINELSTTQFKVPCYVQPFLHSDSDGNATSTNCCGKYQNISTISDVSCSSAKLEFYGTRKDL
uniref:Amino acid transporter transmembrane domain-containing protein n=1 Tax=Panagrolaimus sp. ES5 TaxID=591445 RepID=A0AC34G5P9_9BILA